MNLLSAENISKSYSEKKLLDNISIGINEGDKIGLIGINGTGKSTLLKIIAGVEESDGGRVIKGSSMKIEYLPQNPCFDPEATVLEQVFKGDSPLMKVVREYQEASNNPDTPSDKMVRLTQIMDSLGAWNIENEGRTVLTKLGISQFNAKVGTLSGGQRKRIALAAALINPSDLLILDEPTNHLDNDVIDWLEQYLNKRKGSLLMITHDRYFLDRIANQIIELDRGNLYLYKGNYNNFLEKKLEREEIEAANEKKRQSLFRKELAWIRRGAKARTTKQKARIDRFETLRDQAPDNDNERLDISVASSRLGRKVVQLDSVCKSFGDKRIIDNFSYTLLRDDRVGIVGSNGRGKSTLINIIAGRLQPDGGRVDIGETVRIGLFAQEDRHMDDNQRVIEYLREAGEYASTSEGYKISASQMLERFLFPSALQWTPIGKLSGGERRRLHLLRVLIEAPNVLLLDEPTNDLDIETLTILEDYLEDFQGAVIAVSHDRYFLDKVADKIFAFQEEGTILQYTGNYSEFKEHHQENIPEVVADKKTEDKGDWKKDKEKPLRFTYKEQREFEEIDEIIAGLEKKLEEVEDKISKEAADYVALQKLTLEKEAIEHQLEGKMERWVYLNDLAEKIGVGRG